VFNSVRNGLKNEIKWVVILLYRRRIFISLQAYINAKKETWFTKIISLSSFIHPYFPNTKKLPKSSSLHRQRSNLVYFYFI